MSNLLAKGYDLLVRTMLREATPAGEIEFTPVDDGAAAANMTGKVWVSRTVFSRLPVETGPAIVFGDRDYMVPVEHMERDPQRGDRFRELVNGAWVTFEVMSPLDEPEWRWADPGRRLRRIHVKEVQGATE